MGGEAIIIIDTVSDSLTKMYTVDKVYNAMFLGLFNHQSESHNHRIKELTHIHSKQSHRSCCKLYRGLIQGF